MNPLSQPGPTFSGCCPAADDADDHYYVLSPTKPPAVADLPATAGSDNRRHELDQPRRAGSVSAGQARPAKSAPGRAARCGPAPHAGAAPPGGGPAGRP